MPLNPLKVPPVPMLQKVQGIGVSPKAVTPLSVPKSTITKMGPPGVTDKASVAQTGRMAREAAKAPKPMLAPRGGLQKIRIRMPRRRYLPASPAGGFTPTTGQL